MKQNLWFSLAVLAGLLGAGSGCAFFGKSEPLVPRYFAPDLDTPTESSKSRAPSNERLRLGRIEAGTHLRERMVYRTSEEEVGYYLERRWTERPEVYLRRALSRSLFEERGIHQAVSGAAPTLDVELVEFDEIKGEKHEVRVKIVMTLDDATTTGASVRTITVERDVLGIDKEDPEPVVKALGVALSDVVTQMSDHIVERLAELAPADPAPNPPAGTTTTTLKTTSSPSEADPKE